LGYYLFTSMLAMKYSLVFNRFAGASFQMNLLTIAWLNCFGLLG